VPCGTSLRVLAPVIQRKKMKTPLRITGARYFQTAWRFEKLSAPWRLNTAICFAKPTRLPRSRICDPQAGSRPRNPAQKM